ncbi:hypothetical protein B0H13DRAFT_410253 [Mycena leptocephala]|nr:hypothetical protein B0H13DRAFT_410253 [Mycena leptocephala]
MLWLPCARKTRSGCESSALSLPKAFDALCDAAFDLTPLISRAVVSELDNQEDHEDTDASSDAPLEPEGNGSVPPDPLDGVDEEWPPPGPLDGVDEQWPPPLPHDPFDDVDDDNPTQPAAKRRRRFGGFNFAEVIASTEKPHHGPHRARSANPAKAARQAAASKARRQKKRLKKFKQKGHVPAPSTIATMSSPPFRSRLASSPPPYPLRLEPTLRR